MKRIEFLKAAGVAAIGTMALSGHRTEAAGFNGLKIDCFGDSTTWGANGMPDGGGNAIAWPAKLGTILGAETRNYGKKGSRIAVTSGRNDSFIERMPMVKGDADIVLVMGGVNDFHHDVPLGDENGTDVHTFYGAINTMAVHLIELAPTKRIVFMTPMKNKYMKEGKSYPDSFTKNGQGKEQEDYAEAVMEVAHHYGIPVIDLFNESGISPFIPSQQKLYMPDGLHYSEAGYERLAHTIAGKLSSIYR